jgi:hypothetical protein
MAKGFKAPKMPSGSMGMMGQIQKLQEQIQQVQAQLAEETVSAAAGGGAVTVTVTGDQRCHAVQIDPDVLKDADAEMLQDLIVVAFNSALEKSREMAAERLGPLAGGLPF